MADTGDFIDRIYEAAVLPDAWPGALDALAGAAEARGGIMFVAQNNFAGWSASDSVRDIGQAFFDQGWVSRNARTPKLLAIEPVRFVRDSDVFDDGALSRDPMQAELLVPAGFGREIATRISTGHGENIVVSLHRELALGRYDDRTVARLDRLRPHVARCIALSARLGQDRLRVAVEMLDTVGVPAAMIGSDGRVMASNRLLDAEPLVVARAFSRLGLRSPPAQRRFDAAVAAMERGELPDPPSVALRTAEGAVGAVLHIVPLRRAARDAVSGAVAVVVLTPVGRTSVPSARLLRELFGLSEAEARVALASATGTALQLAQASAVSVETIRSQLKAVLNKTGTHRQAELAALLGGLVLPGGGTG